LGKHFSFLKVKKHSRSFLSFLDQKLIEFNEFIILGHEDPSYVNFIMIPFCQEKEELRENACLTCSYYSPDFQNYCFSCQKTASLANLNLVHDLDTLKKHSCNLEICNNSANSCISCDQIMGKFEISKPAGSDWTPSSFPLSISPFQCEATCNENDEILYIENNQCVKNAQYLKMKNKCSSILDFFNCSYVPFCFWDENNLCKELEENNLSKNISDSLIYPTPSFCSFEMSFSQGTGLLKFIEINVEVRQNHYCLLNLKHSNGESNLEYYSLSIEVLAEFIKESDDNSFILELCTSDDVKGSCKLKPVYIDLSKSQKVILVERSINIFVKMSFLKSLQVDLSKFTIHFNYKWMNFVYWHYRTPYIGLIAFISFFLIAYIVKKILVCLSFRFQVNICHVLGVNSLERKIKRLLKNKYIKKIKFTKSIIEYNQIECPFCLEPFVKNDPLFLISCKHVFHEKCFDVWINHNYENLKCPICRRNLEALDNIQDTSSNLELSSMVIQ